MIALLLLLHAAEPYAVENRRAHLAEALIAIRATDPGTLEDAARYVAVMERNQCRSDFERLRVQCLIERAARNCKSYRDERLKQCTLYSDIIVTNVLSEKKLISEEQRYQLMQKSRDYRTAVREELLRRYGALAAELRVSKHWGTCSSEPVCTAAAIDAYCIEQADRQSLSWQHCAAALVWFIGTSSR